MLVNRAAKPQINDETLATLLFYFMLFPMSIAIKVPIKLQGPEINMPTKKIVRQQGQGSYYRTRQITNITTELSSREGLRNNALLLKKSARPPRAIPPITAPISNIEQMQPFCYLMVSLRSLRIVGSQNSKPQTHPLRQEQEITQLGTRGRVKAENIPYLKTLGSSAFYYCLPDCFYTFQSILSVLQVTFYQFQRIGESQIIDFYNSQSCYFLGLSFMKTIINKPTAKPNPPVKIQFHTKFTLLSESTLSSASAIIFPMLLLIHQIPINNPFLFQANQLLKMPTKPGHPVAWKKPLIHIKIVMRATLQNPVSEYMIIHSIQKTLEIIMPPITQNLSVTLCIRLPKTPIPMEQKARQRASTIPIQVFQRWNSFLVSSLEQDQPSLKAWRAAQPIKVRIKTPAFQIGIFIQVIYIKLGVIYVLKVKIAQEFNRNKITNSQKILIFMIKMALNKLHNSILYYQREAFLIRKVSEALQSSIRCESTQRVPSLTSPSRNSRIPTITRQPWYSLK